MAENGDQEEFSVFPDGTEEGYGEDGLGVEGLNEADTSGAAETAAEEAAGANPDDTTEEDPELEAIKARVREMEEEAEKLKNMQNEVEKQMNLSGSSVTSPPKFPTAEEKHDADGRSVFIGNVDYAATAEELEAHFHGCGSINRVTILCDKFTGHPKGFAYVEFADKDSIATAMALDESLFRGRQIKVSEKRTNKPGISTTDRPPRGRGRGRFSRGGYGGYYGGYAPRPRGRYRPRRYAYYSPY